MTLTVLVGGARSGKSTLAVEIGQRFDQASVPDDDRGVVTFIATAPRTDHHDDTRGAGDDDMADRIRRHVAERPAGWCTVEEPVAVLDAILAAAAGLVIVDCLTLWTANLMWADHADDVIRERARAASAAAAARPDPVIVITNEVGLGIVPDNELARRYRDIHGWVNQEFVRRADRALHLVAGRATPLVDPWTLLDDQF